MERKPPVPDDKLKLELLSSERHDLLINTKHKFKYTYSHHSWYIENGYLISVLTDELSICEQNPNWTSFRYKLPNKHATNINRNFTYYNTKEIK